MTHLYSLQAATINASDGTSPDQFAAFDRIRERLDQSWTQVVDMFSESVTFGRKVVTLARNLEVSTKEKLEPYIERVIDRAKNIQNHAKAIEEEHTALGVEILQQIKVYRNMQHKQGSYLINGGKGNHPTEWEEGTRVA
jgi:hypothetical protein